MLSIKNLKKDYGNVSILKGVSLEVSKGEVVVLIGPSGSGKSTLLRCVNNLETKTSGEIKLDDVAKEEIGMVFQSFNLFNNMSVLDNVLYSLQVVFKMKKKDALSLATQALKKVGMDMHKNKMPQALSGGQKQRAAIARVIAHKPKLLLFDEPTSALDPENVKEVLEVIQALVRSDITIMIVTHKMQFAKEVADTIVFLEHGKIVEYTPCAEFFKKPKTARAQQFLEKVL